MKKIRQEALSVDILLFHGRDISIVECIKELLTSIGLSASKVSDLPSLDLHLDERVDAYIKSSRLRIVIASFDETQRDTSASRPNVYDEIARCLIKTSRNSLIVLREKKEGRLVELPSNVSSKLRVVIEFERTDLAGAMPKLLREVRSRGLLAQFHPVKAGPERGAAAIIIPFMAKMDMLWEKEFDMAWGEVHSADSVAERKLTIYVDKFFQAYHGVFKHLFEAKTDDGNLKQVCELAYHDALDHLAHAWTAVADSKHDQAKQLGSAAPSTKLRKMWEKALAEHRKIEKARTDTEKIELAKAAVSNFQKYINAAP